MTSSKFGHKRLVPLLLLLLLLLQLVSCNVVVDHHPIISPIIKQWSQRWPEWRSRTVERCDEEDDDLHTDGRHELCMTCPVQLFANYAKGMNGSHSFKVLVHLSDGSVGLFKPQSYDRPHTQTTKNNNNNINNNNGDNEHSAYAEEVAAFHMSEVLGFHHVLPTVFVRIPFSACYLQAYVEEAVRSQHNTSSYTDFIDAIHRMIHREHDTDDYVGGSLEHYYDSKLHPLPTPPPPHCGPSDLSDECSEPDVYITAAVFDFLLGNSDRHTGGNILSFDETGKQVVWLDHDSADLTRRYSLLSIYKNQDMYWDLQRQVATARFRLQHLDRVCSSYPRAVLSALEVNPNASQFARTLMQRLAQAGLRVDDENEQRLVLRYQMLLDHVAQCTANKLLKSEL